MDQFTAIFAALCLWSIARHAVKTTGVLLGMLIHRRTAEAAKTNIQHIVNQTSRLVSIEEDLDACHERLGELEDEACRNGIHDLESPDKCARCGARPGLHEAWRKITGTLPRVRAGTMPIHVVTVRRGETEITKSTVLSPIKVLRVRICNPGVWRIHRMQVGSAVITMSTVSAYEIDGRGMDVDLRAGESVIMTVEYVGDKDSENFESTAIVRHGMVEAVACEHDMHMDRDKATGFTIMRCTKCSAIRAVGPS